MTNEAAVLPHDLSLPEYNAPDAPAWCKESLPEWLKPYMGRNGLPSAWRDVPGPLASCVSSIDRYQANNFIVYRSETAEYLYEEYTPLTVGYVPGTLPTYEALSDEITVGCDTDIEKAVALLTKGIARVKHPTVPPCVPDTPTDRGLDDEALLQSGLGWCNEQARVFVRLCHVNNIPARLIHLFYSDLKTGHTIAEFYADGKWRMADGSWLCVFPDADGDLMSAADCHDGGAGQARCGELYYQRFQELLALPDDKLGVPDPEDWRAKHAVHTAETLRDKMYVFAVINYPLPR